MNALKKRFVYLGVTLFALFLLTRYWSDVENIVLMLLYAVAPLLTGFVIAYAVNIPMSFLEKKMFCRINGVSLKIKRPVCMILAFALLAALIFLVTTLIVPELISCVKLLVTEVPPVLDNWYKNLEDQYGISELVKKELATRFGGNPDWKSLVEKAVGLVAGGVGNVMTSVVSVVGTVFSTVFSVFVSLVFAVYLLSGKEKLTAGLARMVKLYLKKHESIRSWLFRVVKVLDDSFHRFVVGQCTEAVILGVLCMIGMTIFRFPYATMIGTLVGFTALIPIAGAYIGAGVGALMILTADSFLSAVLFVVFIIVLQQLEGNLIYPRVVGASIGLPGIWVLTAITVGGAVGGIAGMLVGVPLCATVYKLVSADMDEREAANALVSASENVEETPDSE